MSQRVARTAHVGRNLSLDLVAAVGVGATMALIGSLLPSVARLSGLDPAGLAALAASPFIANVLGAFAGRFGPRTPAKLAALRAAGAALLIVPLLLPAAPVVVAVAIGYWMSLSFGGPAHFRLWGTMYPDRLRGRIVGMIGTSRAAASGIAALLAGLAAATLGGFGVIAAAGVVGVITSISYAGLRAPATDAPPAFSARESVTALMGNPLLRQAALAQACYGTGLIAASALFALVYIDRLGLSLAEVGSIGIVQAVATTGAFFLWGAAADRFGALTVLRVGSTAGFASLLAYLVAGDVRVVWLAALAAGVANAAIDLGIAALISDHTPLETRASTIAGWNAVNGVRGIVAPFLAAALIQNRILDVTGALALCAIATATGVVLYARAGAEGESVGVRDRLVESRLGRGARALTAFAAGR